MRLAGRLIYSPLMKKGTFILFALTILMFTLTACSPAPNKSADSAEMPDQDMAEALSEVEEPAAEPARPKLCFADAEEAMAYMDTCAEHSLYAQGILYNVAKDSLEYCQRLLNNSHSRFIIVDKGAMRVKLYDRYGRLERSYRCALGKNFGNKHSQGDCRTPEGFFVAGKVYDSTEWHYTDENGKRCENPGQYGPRFMRIITPGYSSIGIHGTDAPWSVGKRRSHGCIRLKNESILELVKYVERGMPVIIIPGDKDRRVNEMEELAATQGPTKDSLSIAPAEHRSAADTLQRRADSLHVAK